MGLVKLLIFRHNHRSPLLPALEGSSLSALTVTPRADAGKFYKKCGFTEICGTMCWRPPNPFIAPTHMRLNFLSAMDPHRPLMEIETKAVDDALARSAEAQRVLDALFDDVELTVYEGGAAPLRPLNLLPSTAHDGAHDDSEVDMSTSGECTTRRRGPRVLSMSKDAVRMRKARACTKVIGAIAAIGEDKVAEVLSTSRARKELPELTCHGSNGADNIISANVKGLIRKVCALTRYVRSTHTMRTLNADGHDERGR